VARVAQQRGAVVLEA
jgi:hypothetical protein